MPISFSSPFRMFGMVGLFTLTTGIAYGQSQDLTIHGQVRALSSTDAIVRESAVRQLIGRGVGITASMQRLATSSDPMIRIGAIRVLSGLDAVTPSIEQDVLAILGRLASQEISVDQARGLIFDLGPTAVRHSRQLFEDEAGLSGTAASLYVHIVVRQGLESLTRCDSGASTRADEILSLGGHAIPALFSTLHSMSSSLELRLHSLWLISLVSGSDAVPLLLPLLRDPEPDIQRQVLSLI